MKTGRLPISFKKGKNETLRAKTSIHERWIAVIPAFPIKVFFDGSCPFCAKAMNKFQCRGHGGRLIFVDITSAEFDATPFDIPLEAFMKEMHCIDRDGKVYRGVEALRALWQAFPTSTWYMILAFLIFLPGVNSLARFCYRLFARMRRFLPRHRNACGSGSCQT